MILKGPKFHTILGLLDDLVIWCDEDKHFNDPDNKAAKIIIRESTQEEKLYWTEAMQVVDRLEKKNEYKAVSLRDFEKWKKKKSNQKQ